jgi:hypothetical protein
MRELDDLIGPMKFEGMFMLVPHGTGVPDAVEVLEDSYMLEQVGEKAMGGYVMVRGLVWLANDHRYYVYHYHGFEGLDRAQDFAVVSERTLVALHLLGKINKIRRRGT